MKKSKQGKLPKLPKTKKEAVKLGVPEVHQSTEETGPFEVRINDKFINDLIFAQRGLTSL
jgi:hypothetical protein